MLVRECYTEIRLDEDGKPYTFNGDRMVEMPGVLSVEQAQALEAEQRAEDARTERNARLAACDWTQVADVPLDAAQIAAWAAYRQALRDVTEQTGFPDAINWPVEPAGERVVTLET